MLKPHVNTLVQIAEDKLRYLVGVCLPDPEEANSSDDDLKERLMSNGLEHNM